MKINLHDSNGQNYLVQLDIDDSNFPDSYFSNNNHAEGLNIFTINHRVPDVWRYTIKICKGNIQKLSVIKTIQWSEFDDRLATDAIGTRSILLILESPHTSEFCTGHNDWQSLIPKAPAQGKEIPGKAGYGIDKWLNNVLDKINLPDGDYSFIICEPIPYMCSLGIFFDTLNDDVRNKVWSGIWNVQDNNGASFIKNEFVARCATYQSEYIINCCTNFKSDISTMLKTNGFRNIYETFHPSNNCWNRKNLSVTRIK